MIGQGILRKSAETPPAMAAQAGAVPGAKPAADRRDIRAERDIVAIGVILAAAILFVGTGSSVLTHAVRHMVYGEAGADALLTNALLLNIALIIFGWRRYVDLVNEVAARREAEQAALRLAEIDPLTGLLNRRSFEARLHELAGQSAASGGSLLLMLIDLDRFKLANDAHGHQAGDAVLIETARRTGAMLPGNAAFARLGGDEFAAAVVFAPQIDARDFSTRLASAIGDAIALPVHCADQTVVTSASIGLACAQAGDDQPLSALTAMLMHQADLAMYEAKRGGRCRQCWFEPGIEATIRERSRLEQAIRSGLRRGEFRPYYEKQIDLATGAIIGLEMLARWHSPERGVVPPDVFVPVAEAMGVMPALSEALIRQALSDARDWAPHLSLAINISPVQLRDPWFAQRLLKLLIEAQMPPHRLDIEVTEQCLAEDLPQVLTQITSLRNQGVRISLDDFGHSTSSLAHLRTLPFDRIKIDRNFIADLGHSSDSAAMVEAISALGRGMNLPITAEGIENDAILTELRRLGSFQGQGYLYGRPLSGADMRHELASAGLLAATPARPAAPDEAAQRA